MGMQKTSATGEAILRVAATNLRTRGTGQGGESPYVPPIPVSG